MLIGVDANEANQPQRVGSNQFAFNLLHQLNQLDKTNAYRVYLKKPPLKSLPAASKRWHYHIIPSVPLWTQWRLPLDLYRTQPQPKIFLTLGHYAPRFSPIPTLVCIMDLAYLKFPETYLKKDLLQLTLWTKRSIKQAKHIFTISHHSKKDIINTYQINPDKITVTYPGLDSASFQPVSQNQTSQIIDQYNLGKKYLLYLGTLQPRKNLINLVKAFSQLPEKYSDLKLVIAGKKGWLYQSLFNLVNQLNLNSKVVFTDFFPSQDLPALISGASFLILPSYYEGFGIPVAQAMALGIPVITSQNSSLPEIVGQTGIYIKAPFGPQEIKQSIIKGLKLSPKQRQNLINQAKSRVKKFTWQTTAKKTLEVINALTF